MTVEMSRWISTLHLTSLSSDGRSTRRWLKPCDRAHSTADGCRYGGLAPDQLPAHGDEGRWAGGRSVSLGDGGAVGVGAD